MPTSPPPPTGPDALLGPLAGLARTLSTAADDLLEAQPTLSPPSLQRRVDDLVDELVAALGALADETAAAAARVEIIAASRREGAQRADTDPAASRGARASEEAR